MTTAFPGEVRFNSDLEVDLREGRSVLLRLPEGESTDLLQRTRMAFGQDWIDLTPPEQVRSPLGYLFEEFAPDRAIGDLKDLRRLYELSGFKGSVVAIHALPSREWPSWISFLAEFADFSRSVDRYDQTKLLLICAGWEAGRLAPVNDVLLADRSIDGYFGRIDSRLAAHLILIRKSRTALDYSIAESICCELALWDTALASRLADLPLATLFEPTPVLLEVAKELGFDGSPALGPADGLWKGWYRTVDQDGQWHSCHLAVQGRSDAIRNRIWRGQTASILPFLESERQQLVKVYRQDLKLPHRDKEGRVVATSPEDLELGHLYAQFCNQSSRVPAETRRQVGLLREVRNTLAHFQPITAAPIHQGLLAPMPWHELI